MRVSSSVSMIGTGLRRTKISDWVIRMAIISSAWRDSLLIVHSPFWTNKYGLCPLDRVNDIDSLDDFLFSFVSANGSRPRRTGKALRICYSAISSILGRRNTV